MERVIVVIDKSASMRGSPFELSKNFAKGKRATSIWGFDNSCRQYQEIDNMVADGFSTNIRAALTTVFNDMKQHHGGKQTLFFITDAQDNCGMNASDEKEFINTWDNLQQNNGATGNAHFFGDHENAPCKQILKNIFGSVTSFTTKQLEKIEKKLKEHNASMDEIVTCLNETMKEMEEIDTKSADIDDKVTKIEERIKELQEKCEIEKKELESISQEMENIKNDTRGIENNSKYIQIKKQFDKFKKSVTDTLKILQTKKRECVEIMLKAHEEVAKAQRERLHLEQQQKENNDVRSDALRKEINSLKQQEKLIDTGNELFNQGGDFAYSQIEERQSKTLKDLRLSAKKSKKIACDAVIRNKRLKDASDDLNGTIRKQEEIYRGAEAAKYDFEENERRIKSAVSNFNNKRPIIDSFLKNLHLSHLSEVFKRNGIITKQHLKGLRKQDLTDLLKNECGERDVRVVRNKIWRAIQS